MLISSTPAESRIDLSQTCQKAALYIHATNKSHAMPLRMLIIPVNWTQITSRLYGRNLGNLIQSHIIWFQWHIRISLKYPLIEKRILFRFAAIAIMKSIMA